MSDNDNAPSYKFQMPNLGNATQEFLIDEIGKLNETIKDLEKLQGVYKEALKARIENPIGGQTYAGEQFEMLYSEVTQERLDNDALKASLGDMINQFKKVISFTQMRFTRKK